MEKNLRITEENHQKLELIKAKDRDLKSYDDVIARLIELYEFNYGEIKI